MVLGLHCTRDVCLHNTRLWHSSFNSWQQQTVKHQPCTWSLFKFLFIWGKLTEQLSDKHCMWWVSSTNPSQTQVLFFLVECRLIRLGLECKLKIFQLIHWQGTGRLMCTIMRWCFKLLTRNVVVLKLQHTSTVLWCNPRRQNHNTTPLPTYLPVRDIQGGVSHILLP